MMHKKIMVLLAFTLLFSLQSTAEEFILRSPDLTSTMSKTEEFSGFGCNGDNRSPALEWAHAPAGTQSFAVTLYDETARFWHWEIYNIPANQTKLPADAGNPQKALAPKGSVQGKNDYGTVGFGGPCPPKGSGVHRYVYTVYALKVPTLNIPAKSKPEAIASAIEKESLAKASIVSGYSR
jgi:Raf kinase inhibitor-like YbhB/YbcL family protein